MRLARPLLSNGFRVTRAFQTPTQAIGETQPDFGTPHGNHPENLNSLNERVDQETSGPLPAYLKLVQQGSIREDKHQLAAIDVLQQVGSLFFMNSVFHSAPEDTPPSSALFCKLH